jgi:hypothetical protein
LTEWSAIHRSEDGVLGEADAAFSADQLEDDDSPR